MEGTTYALAPYWRTYGFDSRLADMSDTTIWRLMTRPDGEVVVVPLVAN